MIGMRRIEFENFMSLKDTIVELEVFKGLVALSKLSVTPVKGGEERIYVGTRRKIR
jgi:hypothetical protein